MKGLGNIQQLLQQAQAAQGKLRALQEELAERTIEASSGGGMVKVVVNGRQEVVSLEVDNEVVKNGDRQMLQDLVIAAVNQGIKKSQEMVAEEVGKLTGGLSIPGLL